MLEPRIPAKALNNQVFAHITHRSEPVTLVTSGNHRELLIFFTFNSPATLLILGFPWLGLHNPHIDWSGQWIASWSLFCHSNCLTSTCPHGPVNPHTIHGTAPDLTSVPSEYHDLQEVFSKQKSLSLPPNRPYDSVIYFLQGSATYQPPVQPVCAWMSGHGEVYLGIFAAGIISLSSFPVGANFFFVRKKDGTLWPCIDYRKLNDITIKNKYPFPLINSAFEPLQGATVFTKLDLCNTYHLVCIRKGDK